jgi:hypothetical protein
MSDNNLKKPTEFKLAIQGGMLAALGINMYSTVGKCLVEFVANAYDGNAHEVKITIPFAAIETERDVLRAADKKEKASKKEAAARQAVESSAGSPGEAAAAQAQTDAAATSADVSLYTKILSDGVRIVVEDNGHGMSPEDVATKFLPINRHRRLDKTTGQESNLRSEGGKRAVMGRKGLGKLAGFGIASQVIVETKRRGDLFSTVFTLDSVDLGAAENLPEISIPATYVDETDAERCGTKLTLAGLKPDAVRSNADKITSTLAEAFYGIRPADFSIKLNDTQIESKPVDYDFVYPPEASADTLAHDVIEIVDVGSIPIGYAVRFRKPGEHLTAGKRGARIYCNNRLAAGPSLFKLGTGMHNFHAQDYLECVVVADTLDQLGVDFVNTNRTQLREDNDVVDAVLTRISSLMKEALAAHAKHRESRVGDEIKSNADGERMNKIIDLLPKRSRAPAGKLLRTIALRHGVDSVEFKELAPLVVNSVNAGEVLIRLIELQSDATTVNQVALQLVELGEIERSDALKLYRGRRSGIISLRNLIQKGEELWRTKAFEAELHALFKRDPWLIKPEYSKYLTSDSDLNKLASKLAEVLNVDKFAPILTEDGSKDKDRPDLVFVMSDALTPHVVTIVEFKSPSLPLAASHLAQLKGYMQRVQSFLRTELSNHEVKVRGYLIGAMPGPDTKAHDQAMLRYELENRDDKAQWEVLGLEHLLQRALTIHSDAIEVFERELHDGAAGEAVAAVAAENASAAPGGVAASTKPASVT